MDARAPGLEGHRLQDLYCLHRGFFQTPADRAQLRAAICQVFGGQPWAGCCSDKLLEALLEAGQRGYLKQQLYWDFQLLDSDHDGCLSVRDAELLLAQVPRAHATGEAWQDFLRSRGPGVTWRDIEDWLFRAPQLPVDGPHAGLRQGCHHEQGSSARVSTPLYQWGVRSRVEQLLERWDSGGLATLLGEEPSGVLAALERKYWVLQRKLGAEMLQVHYGQPAWALLPQNAKEDKLSELEALVDVALRAGSILPLSSLPGAQHVIRSRARALKREASGGHASLPAGEETAAQALQELRHRKQAETAATLAQRHLLVGSKPEASRRLLQLHAQTELVQQEASFQAALLATELSLAERFWDSQSIILEACHQELAQLRLAAGHGQELAWREAKTVPGRSMMQVLLDRLLLQQERDRTCLVQSLLALTAPEMGQERGCSRKSRNASRTGCGEDMSPALQEAITQMLKLAQKRLEVARKTEVLWQDCAVAVLVDLQHAQQEELSQTIEDLAGMLTGREGEACPALYEKLLARLQEPPLMSLLRHLQPTTPWEQHTGETLRVDLEACHAQELLLCEVEAFTAKKMFQREEASGPPSKQSKMQVQRPHNMASKSFPIQRKLQPEWEGLGVHPQRGGPEESDPQLIVQLFQVPTGKQGQTAPQKPQGPLLNKPETSEDHGGGPEGRKESVVQEASGASQVDQNLPQVQRIPAQKTRSQGLQFQSLNLHSFQLQTELLRKSKSLGSLEFVTLRPQGLRDPEIPLQIPKGGQYMANFPEAGKDETLDSQSHSDAQGTSLMETEVIQAGGMRKAVDVKPETFLQRKQDSLTSQKQGDSQVVHAPNRKGQENSQVQGTPWMKQEPLQIYEDKECLALQALGIKGPQEGGTPEPSQFQGLILLLNKSKSLDPQELSRDIDPQRSPQRGLEISGPIECRHSPLCQEWKEANAQTEQELKELEDSYKRGDIQRGTEASQIGRKPEDFQSQKLQTHRPEESPLKSLQEQGVTVMGIKITGLQNIQKTHAFPVEDDGAAKTPPSQNFQLGKPTSLNLRESQALQAHERKHPETSLAQGIIPQKQTGIVECQGCRSAESPPLLWRHLWQKAKSLDLGKPYVFSTQELSNLELIMVRETTQKELQVPQLQEMKRSFWVQSQEEPQMETEMHNKPQQFREPKRFYPQKLREPEGPQVKEGVPTDLQCSQHQGKRKIPQEAARSWPQILQSQEISWREPELPRPSGAVAQRKLKELEPHQPQKRKETEYSPPRESIPPKETWIPQPQESRNTESPPLLWGMLGMKSKSFELRKPHALESQVLRGLLLSQTQGRYKMEPEVHKPQRYKDTKIFSLQELKDQEAPEIPAGQENVSLPGRLLTESHESQEGRGPEILQLRDDYQETPQKMASRPENQETSTSALEIPNSPDAGEQELRDPQDLPSYKGECLEVLETQGTSKMMLQPQERRSPETPPLLWRVLGLKAKSFELRKPRTFQTQKIEYLAQEVPEKELQVPQLQEMKRAQMVQPLGGAHVIPESHQSKEYGASKIFDLQEFRETRGPQTQKETFHEQGMMPTNPQTFQPSGSHGERGPGIPQSQCSLLRSSKEMKNIQSQEPRGLKDPQRLHKSSQSHKKPHQESGEVQASQSQKTKNPEVSQLQPTPEMERGFLHPPEHKSPGTPPLLWRVLKLKAKSFELRKPRTFQTQKIQHIEPVFLTQIMPKEPHEEKNLELLPSQPASEMETGCLQHMERRSPETPPLLWWVLEVVQHEMAHRELLISPQLQEINKSLAVQPQGSRKGCKVECLHSGVSSSQGAQCQEMEVGPVPLQESLQIQREPQDAEGSSWGQKIIVQKELRDLEPSVPQEKLSEMWASHQVSCLHSSQPQLLRQPGTLQPMPKSLQAQRVLQRDSEDCCPSDLRDSLALHPDIPLSKPESGEDIKPGSYLEPLGRHSETKRIWPPGRLIGKSKSLDFRERQAPKPHELAEPESPQAQGESQQRPKVFQVQKNPQMKIGKPKNPKGPQTFKSQENSDPGIVSAQSSQHLFQPQGASAEVLPLQSTLKPKSESTELMKPLPLQIEELRGVTVLQTLQSLQMHPENLDLHKSIELKTICPQGQCEAERREFGVEEQLLVTQGHSQSESEIVLPQEISQLQTALHPESKSFEPQEQSNPCALQLGVSRKSEIPQVPEGPQSCLQVLENQVQEGLESLPTPEMSQVAENPLQETSMPKMERKPSVQRELKGLEISQPLEKQSETLEFMGQGESSTQLSLGNEETKPYPLWGTLLGKSKSLDLGELQTLHLDALREVENSTQKNRRSPKTGLLQTKMQNELRSQKFKDPMVLHSKALQAEEFPPKHQGDPQLQEECEAQGPQLETLQAQKTLESQVCVSQELRDAPIFHPKECRELKILPLQKSLCQKESLQTQTVVQRLSEAVEAQGPVETQPLNPQEKRNLESPPILKGLLKKSKTIGPELLPRREPFQNQHCRSQKNPQGQVLLKPETLSHQLQGLVEQNSHNIQFEVLQHQKLLNAPEGSQDFSGGGNLDSQEDMHKMEVGPIQAQKSLHVSNQEQVTSGFATPQLSLSQALPPHKVPQFGITLLQELGRLHNELEALKPPDLEDERASNSQMHSEAEDQIAAEFWRTLGCQIPQHQQCRGPESHQPPLINQKVPEVQRLLQKQQQTLQPPQNQQRDQRPCHASGILKMESDMSTEPSILKTPQAIRAQECVSERTPGEAGGQESREPKNLCPQEAPQTEGKVREKEPEPTEIQEQHPLMLQGGLLRKSKSLEPQQLSRTWDFQSQGTRGAESLQPQARERGLEPMPSSPESLHSQPQPLQPQATFPKNRDIPKEQDIRHASLLLAQHQAEAKAQQREGPLGEQQKSIHLSEAKDVQLCQVCKEQELQREVETQTLEPWGLKEPQAFQEWRAVETLSGGRPQLRTLSAPGMYQLGLEDLDPAVLRRSLEASPPGGQGDNETWGNAHGTSLSQPSPGSRGEDLMQAALSVGTFRETSTCVAQPGRPSGMSWVFCPGRLHSQVASQPQQPDRPSKNQAPPHRTAPVPGSREQSCFTESGCSLPCPPGEGKPPPPRPPRREKAFIRLSRQEKEAALQRLADLQAEGERRHQQDKERQILRFQERLSIAKHRKSEDDLLEGSPTERWPLPAEPQGQDQVGQKTALKRHLEKVKRERTYVMQSKRERNTLRFKELLNPLVSHSEERPEPGQPGNM